MELTKPVRQPVARDAIELASHIHGRNMELAMRTRKANVQKAFSEYISGYNVALKALHERVRVAQGLKATEYKHIATAYREDAEKREAESWSTREASEARAAGAFDEAVEQAYNSFDKTAIELEKDLRAELGSIMDTYEGDIGEAIASLKAAHP